MPEEKTRDSIRDSDSSDYSKFYDSEYDFDEDDRFFDDSSSQDDGVNVRKPKFPEFRADIDMKNPSFNLGMFFGIATKLKAAVREYEIKEGKWDLNGIPCSHAI
ncbi:unnamed protein product [Ilex paraguariensis]|uniref:Uncharacterized protein n=1 Tax=Ilex paraguariensis TaxID=185542 RepID=A0ABC8RR27_9AQUA